MGQLYWPSRPRRIALVMMLLVGLVAVALLVGFRFLRSARDTDSKPDPEVLAPGLAAPDPRLAYVGPFKNIHPDVAYVSDAVCAQCHPREAETYSRHPMARTLMPIDQVEFLPLDAKAHNPFEAFGQRFQVRRRGGRIWHTRAALDSKGEPLFQQEIPVHFAIGSGTHGQSYLSIRGSAVLQSPISSFVQNHSMKTWDLSPGFAPNVLSGRRTGADCLFCHSNGANEDPTEERTFRQPIFPNGHGIGCQRCHGPGGEHVRNPGIVKITSGEHLDPTIVNPSHLAPRLREAVCWQCHLEGEVRVVRRGRQRYDYRPGMPLEEFVGVYEDAAENSFEHVNNHVEQMVQSRCYQKRTGPSPLNCLSCHDPHEKPAPDKQVAHYRSACLKCHREDSCSLPHARRLEQNKDDSCVACHMPSFRTSNVAHVSSTDHRIPRKPIPAARADMRKGPVRDLVAFFEKHRVTNDPEAQRDRALAAALLALRGRRMIHPLDRELEEAARRDVGDLAVKAHHGIGLFQRHDPEAALAVLKDVLARQPDHEWGLFGYAITCGQLNQVEEAVASWRRLIELVPAHGGYRYGLIELLMNERMWEQAAEQAQAWIAVDPGFPPARALLRDCLLQLGRIAEANKQDRFFNELTLGQGSRR
jgi:tetratricopeptide (TPR) repeat protein